MKLLDYCSVHNVKVIDFIGKKKYVATGDVINNKIVSYNMVTYDKKPSRANLTLSKDEILFAKMKNTIKVILGEEDNINNIYSTGFYCLKPNEKVLPKMLYYYLQSVHFNSQKNMYCVGATMKSLNDKGLDKIHVEFPELNIQQKIVEYLDKITLAIENRKKIYKDYEMLINSKYIDLFGTEEDNKFPIYKLEELTTKISDGVHSKPNYTDKGIPFISVKDMTLGKLKFEDCKFISEEDYIKYNNRCNPEKGDILYSKVGATYGRSAIIDTDIKFSLYVSVALLKPKKNIINPLFLNYTMRQPYVKKQADKSIKGIGVPDLHLVEIKNFNIILPPISLQVEFSEFVNKISLIKNKCLDDISDLLQLYNSKLKEYFN